MPALPPDPPEPQHQTDEAPERFGPLVLWRLVKDDGRSLINFSWAGRDDGVES